MPGITKSPLFASLKKGLLLALEANKTGMPTDEILSRATETNVQRRRFLGYAGSLAAAGLLAGCAGIPVLPGSNPKKSSPKIANPML